MPRRVRSYLPADGIYRFQALIRREGTRGRRITIPATAARGLQHLGWSGHDLICRCQGHRWIGCARRMGGATVLAVPRWVEGEPSTPIEMSVEIPRRPEKEKTR